MNQSMEFMESGKANSEHWILFQIHEQICEPVNLLVIALEAVLHYITFHMRSPCLLCKSNKHNQPILELTARASCYLMILSEPAMLCPLRLCFQLNSLASKIGLGLHMNFHGFWNTNLCANNGECGDFV